MKKTFLVFLLFNAFIFELFSQQSDTLSLSLSEIVALAQSDAPDALLAETRMKNRYWSYQSSLADFKPGISLNGQLPNLNRSIQVVTLPTGRDSFIQRSQMLNEVNLSLEQQVGWTGGTVFARTGLQRLDIFQVKAPDLVSYFSTPISVGFNQPLFAVNQMKWAKKIEPLRYQEAEKSFAEEMENVAYQASQLFFEVFISQLNLEAAKRDKANADTLFNISKGRFEVGRIAETELLQIELSSMNADAAVQLALLDLQSGTERLRNFLGIRKSTFFKLEAPEDIPDYIIEMDRAMQMAKMNRSDVVAFDRRLAEADQNVAEAKANSGLQMDLFGVVSLSQTSNSFNDAFKDPLDNESLRLGVQIPIADWGKARARLETACSNRELERMNVEQERVNFEQEIILKVKQFDLIRGQVALSYRAYEVSQKREQLTRNRYFIGKIGVTDLNIAVNEKESARRGYMNSLREFWLAHYDLRRMTLYDFGRDVSLVRRVDDLGGLNCN
jgi:outer membrane protein TolC